MYQIPLNRWTVGAVVALLAFFGGDLIEPIMKALAVLTSSHMPAV